MKSCGVFILKIKPSHNLARMVCEHHFLETLWDSGLPGGGGSLQLGEVQVEARVPRDRRGPAAKRQHEGHRVPHCVQKLFTLATL